jgi:multidrug efflux pump subunit AcrA (membrane-fusion protein)
LRRLFNFLLDGFVNNSCAPLSPFKPPRLGTAEFTLGPMTFMIVAGAIEAMKMETALHAERDGKVAEVLVKAGDQIDAKDLLVVFG